FGGAAIGGKLVPTLRGCRRGRMQACGCRAGCRRALPGRWKTMNDPNVDPVELKKFSDLAHRWWDPNGAFRPLHLLNPVRMDWIERHVPLAGCSVLDVGCGGGILSEAMSARGAKVLGIDLAGKSLQVARLHALESGAKVEYRAIS